jgi:hypothetical protein
VKKDFITNKWWYGVGSIILPEKQFMFLRLCIHAHVPNICTASKALRFWAQTTLWFKGPTTSSSKPQLSSKQDCKNLRQINFWIFGLESKQLLPHLLTSCALMGWAWFIHLQGFPWACNAMLIAVQNWSSPKSPMSQETHGWGIASHQPFSRT